MTKLLVGLGNPGAQYHQTRHNVGRIIIDAYIDHHDAQWSSDSKSHAIVSDFIFFDQKIIACKPQTYMNLSGKSVQYLSQYYQIDPADILVISDDLDLVSGKLRMRLGGSAGGHNGLKDIASKIGTNQFRRCKYGIGRPSDSQDIVGYVLSRLSPDEHHILDTSMMQIVQAIDARITEPRVISHNLS